jgi:ATP-dependent DNA ligase
VRILQLEPARAKAKSPDALWDHPEWVMEPKLNGWRFAMHYGRDLDRTYLTGRRTSKRTGELSEKGMLVPQLWITFLRQLSEKQETVFIRRENQVVSVIEAYRPDAGYTVLDGEIMPPFGCDFHDLAAFMNSDVATAQKMIVDHGPPTYRVFDVLFADGVDVREQPQIERRRILVHTLREIRNPLISKVEQMQPSRHIYEQIVRDGGEGVILKNICGGYGESGQWIKVKKFVTIDAIVTGFTQARVGRTGKFLGQVGAVVLSVLKDGVMVEVAQASGMSDELRLGMTQSPEKWLGRVVEIRAQEWGQDRLLHPRFERMRPDADPSAATWAKMQEDLGVKVEQRVVRGEQRELPL